MKRFFVDCIFYLILFVGLLWLSSGLVRDIVEGYF